MNLVITHIARENSSLVHTFAYANLAITIAYGILFISSKSYVNLKCYAKLNLLSTSKVLLT